MANNTNSVVSATDNIQYALEMSQGWFERHNIRTGMTVRSQVGELRNTFHRQH